MRDPKVSNVPNESKLQRALMPNSRMFLLFLIVFAVITFFFSDRLWLSICEGVIILLLIIYSVIMRARKRRTLERYIESVTYDTESARNNTLQNFPLPMAVFRPADSQVIWANQNFFDLCGRHKPTVDMRITDVIPEFSGRWLLEGNTQCPELLEYQGHKYQIHGNLVRTNPDDAASYMGITYWVDVTDYEKIRLEYYASRPIIAVIVIALRAQRRRKLAQTLEKRRDDEVQYAFIVNPSKPQAEARRLHIQRFCEAKGLNRIRFYDTQLDKDGRVCALEALEDGADVVIAVGGDGTVRTVASAVSGTGHALGIIPIGTGNLFARNMGVPVDDIDAALTVATSHGSRLVDMGRLTLLDHPEDDHGHAFLIIAGIGFDAAMIDDTNPELKANISWLAYFVGGVKNLFAPKFRGTLTVTSADGSTHTIKNLDFRTVMAGNCGQIPMFSLMPAASYDDGLLDFEIIDTTGGILGWANLFGDVVHQTIIGKPEQNPLSTNSTIEQVQGVSAEITLEKPAKAQVDGDMLPETRHIRFSVDHRALIVRVPDASALEKTAQAAASNATSNFAEMTGTLEPIR